MKTKICSRCKKEKPLSEFPWNKKKARPLARCYKCRRKEYIGNENTKQRLRNRNLIKSYGITLEEYNLLFLKQGGKCLICGIHQRDLKQSLNIDHEHITGNIRGLLCPDCNRGLGCFKDNKEIMKKAIKYLKPWTS